MGVQRVDNEQHIRSIIQHLVADRTEIRIRMKGETTLFISRFIQVRQEDMGPRIGKRTELIIGKLAPDRGNVLMDRLPKVVAEFLLNENLCRCSVNNLGTSVKDSQFGFVVSLPDVIEIEEQTREEKRKAEEEAARKRIEKLRSEEEAAREEEKRKAEEKAARELEEMRRVEEKVAMELEEKRKAEEKAAARLEEKRTTKRFPINLTGFVSVEFKTGKGPKKEKTYNLNVTGSSRNGLSLLVTQKDFDLLKTVEVGDRLKDMMCFATTFMIMVDATVRHKTKIKKGEHKGCYILGVGSTAIISR